MHISLARIENYKSFASSEATFGPGFNIVVGANNAGKTALLEAVNLRFEDRLHRSLHKSQTRGSATNQFSVVSIEFVVTREEIRDFILSQSIDYFFLPIPDSVDPHRLVSRPGLESAFERFIRETNIIECEYREKQFTLAKFPWYTLIGDRVGKVLKVNVEKDRGRFVPEINVTNTSHNGMIDWQMAHVLRERIYRFRAERMNIGNSGISLGTELNPDASNLPTVLSNLTANPSRFKRYQDLIRVVFPEIQQITIPTVRQEGADTHSMEVRLWSVDPASERADLAIPLSESGTGISQVLAILYVVLTSEHPRAIIIDEPQSFLHPGAIRKLLEILSQQFSQHQYIITTHSPLILTATNPTTMLLVTKKETESSIERLDVQEAQHLQRALSEVGARLADYYGVDNILWVEGPTEEQSFRLIITQLLKRSLLGTQLLPILSTSELEGKQAKRIIEIYNKLSGGSYLLPPAIAFVLDREERTEEERTELQRRSDNRVQFLERRMYENYLLEPDALAYLINRDDIEREREVTSTHVQEWLDAHRWDAKYFGRNVAESKRTAKLWLSDVHAGKLLNDLFNALTGQRVSYSSNKVEYGYVLTEWLLNNAPDKLVELATFLADVLDAGALSNDEKANNTR